MSRRRADYSSGRRLRGSGVRGSPLRCQSVPRGFLMLELPEETRPPFTLGAVNGVAFVLIIAMTLITAPWGAALAHRLDARPLKRVFGVFLLAVAVNMIWEALG